jgi:hypothetical protein
MQILNSKGVTMNNELVIKVLKGEDYQIAIYKQEFETGDNFGYTIMKVQDSEVIQNILMGDGYTSEDEVVQELSDLSTALKAIFG